MHCAKCGQKIKTPTCTACGFSHASGLRLLVSLDEGAYVFSSNSITADEWVARYFADENNKIAQFEQAAERGDVEACKQLADYYYSKVNHCSEYKPPLNPVKYFAFKTVNPEVGKAVFWATRVLTKGGAPSPNHLYIIAIDLIAGALIRHESTQEQGMNFLRIAAEQGCLRAQKLLSQCLEKGMLCQRNAEEAREWRLKHSQNMLNATKDELVGIVKDAWNGSAL